MRNWLLLCAVTLTLFAQTRFALTNSNFTVSQGSYLRNDASRYLYNYDRLRLQADYTESDFFATCIGDGVNYLSKAFTASNSYKLLSSQRSNTPYVTQTKPYNYEHGALYAKLYRLYGGFDNGTHRINVGLQNIAQGVGQIFNPINLFNPRNAYAIEPDEVFGVSAIAYTYYSEHDWQATVISSIDSQHRGRYNASLQQSHYAIHSGLTLFHSAKTDMAGFTLTSNLANSGIALRSESAAITSRIHALQNDENIAMFQTVLGLDYAFENGLNTTLEILYSSETFTPAQQLLNLHHELLNNLVQSPCYVALAFNEAFTPYLEGGLFYVESVNTYHSRFVAPTMTYTLNDYNQITLGMQLTHGASHSEFGAQANRYYLAYILAL